MNKLFKIDGLVKRHVLMLFISFVVMAYSHRPIYASVNETFDFNLNSQNVYKNYKDNKCGEVRIINENSWPADHIDKDFISIPGRLALKYKRQGLLLKKRTTDKFSYQTPESIVYLKNNPSLNLSNKNTKEYMKYLLLNNIFEKVHKLIEHEFSLLEDPQFYYLKEDLDDIIRNLASMTSENYQKKLNTILSIYPKLFEDIINDANDELRPLLCQFMHKEHDIKMIKRWSMLVVIPAASLGITSLVLGTGGISLVPLTIGAGACAFLVGAKDIGFGIYLMKTKNYSAHIATQMLALHKSFMEIRNHLLIQQENVRLSSSQNKLLKKLDLYHQSEQKTRKKELKKIIFAKKSNILLITFGVINLSFNSVNLSGDSSLLASIPENIFSLLN